MKAVVMALCLFMVITISNSYGIGPAGLGGGSSDDGEELASMANCRPELRTVELDLPHDPRTNYYPTCVRIEQCGGCCFSPILTCRPTVTKSVKLKVLKSPIVLRTSGRGRSRSRQQSTTSYHTVSVVKHTACECGCKVQESDCNLTIHNYHERECECVCKDRDKQAKCERQSQSSLKFWWNDICECKCRNIHRCAAGEYFSHSSCRCISDYGRPRISTFKTAVVNETEGLGSHIVSPWATIPLNTTRFPANSVLKIPCIVEGYPEPDVKWLKGEVEIVASEKYAIQDDHTLVVRDANTFDSGRYTCEVENEYDSYGDSTMIYIGDVFVSPTCEDNPQFQKCFRILQLQLCTVEDFSKLCCKSCTENGYLTWFPGEEE